MKPRAQTIGIPLFVTDEGYDPPHHNIFLGTGWSKTVSCPFSNNGNHTNPTPWNYQVITILRIQGVYKESWLVGPPATITMSGNIGTVPPMPPWDERGNAYNDALSRLNDKVRGELDLSVSLAEHNQTEKMIKRVGKLLRKAPSLLKKSLYKTLAGGAKRPGGKPPLKLSRPPNAVISDVSRDLANGWLEWTYGWKPLMDDIYGVANESIEIVRNDLRKIKARSKLSLSGSFGEIRYDIHTLPKVPVNRKLMHGNWKQSAFQSCEVCVTLDFSEKDHNLDRWTSLNPVSIAYELVPYSFVVDWFYDMGSYLRNLETALLYNGLVFKRGYKSEIYRFAAEDRVDFYAIDDYSYGKKYVLQNLEADLFKVEFQRSSMSSYPFPQSPSLRADLGWRRLTSAAALLRQMIK